MLKYVPDLVKAVHGLGLVVNAESSLAKMALRHWPITGIILAAWGSQIYRRWKNKDLTLYTALIDSGAILGPAVSLMVLTKISREVDPTRTTVKSEPLTTAPSTQSATSPTAPQAAIQSYFDNQMST